MTTVTLSQQDMDELVTRLTIEIRLIVQQELQDVLQKQSLNPSASSTDLALDLPILDVGPWPNEMGSLSRVELYSDDERG